MSHGKIDKDPQNNDGLVERLNRVLARLMGKKPANRAPKVAPVVPSNRRFILIVVGMIVLLWGLTGIYYIPEDNYGLIFRNGKITHSVKGMDLGITLPYPLSNVETLDAGINNLSIGKESGNLFQLTTQDNQTLQLTAELSYTIIDPQKYYTSYYQETSDLNQKIAWLVMANTQKYFLHYNRVELLNASSIVLANEIRQQSTQQLASYGLQLDKFNILTLQSIGNLPSVSAASESSPASQNLPLSAKLMQQALSYQQTSQAKTESMMLEYKQLLPQYRANKSAIVELIYYKMLSSIPAESTAESYPLLKLTQEQFMRLIQNPTQNLSSIGADSRSDIRAVDRSVNRQRNTVRELNYAQ